MVVGVGRLLNSDESRPGVMGWFWRPWEKPAQVGDPSGDLDSVLYRLFQNYLRSLYRWTYRGQNIEVGPLTLFHRICINGLGWRRGAARRSAPHPAVCIDMVGLEGGGWRGMRRRIRRH